MSHIYELRHGVDQDDWELGIRVASAFYLENESGPESFLTLLKLRHRWVSDRKGKIDVISN